VGQFPRGLWISGKCIKNFLCYLDENGEYQDIDNSLSVSGSEISTSNAKIKFAKKTTGNNNLFTLHDDNRKLTLALDNANKKIEGKITNNKTEFGESATQLQKMTTLDNISASVIYEDILANTDLEYVINGLNIKENIIVKAKADSYSYSFTMQLNNLTAELDEKGGICIYDDSTSETVYTIPSPVMWDSDHASSDAVSMALTQHGNGKYTITVTADSEWMNASERVYPVTIDPPIYTTSASAILDLDVCSTYPNRNKPADDSLWVNNAWHAYWKFTTLPTLPVSAYITDAEFTLHSINTDALDGYIAAYEVLTDWDSTLTWNKVISSTDPQGQPSTSFVDFEDIYTYDPDGNGSLSPGNALGYTLNITPLVKKWYDGQNYGLMIAPVTGKTFTGTAKFASNDTSATAKTPKLCIKYVDMKGIEDHWSFSTQSAGFAGIGYVNHATGNLVFSIPTLTTTDALMPITPSLVYNFEMDFGYYTYPTAQTANSTAFTPKSFKLNINETLIKKSFNDSNGDIVYYIIWADGDGTEHYFMPTGTADQYQDEDGLMLTLNESGGSCTITDTSNTVRTFTSVSSPSVSEVSSAWHLASITDKSGNAVVFGFDSSNRPITVSLKPNGKSSIEQLRISYNTAGMPYAVWNPASGEGVIFRYSNTYSGSIGTGYGAFLKNVVRAHGGTTESAWLSFYNTNSNTSTATITVDGIAEYGYNYLGLITNVTNTLSQYRLIYNTYTSKRISVAREYSTNTSADGQKIKFSYLTSSTELRTSGKDDVYETADDLITVYGFDNCGRTVSCYTTDLNKTQIYGASNGQYVGNENENAKNNLKSSVQTTLQASNYLLNGGFEKTSSTGIPYWNSSSSAYLEYYTENPSPHCIALPVSSTATTSYISQDVNLEKGEYSLSMMINTHNTQNISVYLKAESSTDSTHTVIQEIPINESYASGEFAFAGINFTSDPSDGDTEPFTISVVVTGSPSSTMTVFVDELMLSRTLGAAEYDSVQMGHFESSESYSPSSFWSYHNSSTPITVVDSGIAAFGDVLYVDAPIDEEKFVMQEIYRTTDEQKTNYDMGAAYDNAVRLYTVSGWGKGTAQSYSGASDFSIRVEVKYYNGTTYGTTENHYFEFDRGITDWQFVSGGFATDPSKGLIDTITVYIMYTNHAGDGYFDSISVLRDSDTTSVYGYNANGYISSYQVGRHRSWYSYYGADEESAGEIKFEIRSNGDVIDYTYDSQRRVEFETHSRYNGTVPSNGAIDLTQIDTQYVCYYAYNAYGQPTFTTVSEAGDGGKTLNTSTAYNVSDGSHIFGTVASETDSLGKVTRYFYNENNGRLLASISPDGNGVSYTYDGVGNLTQVLPATATSSSNTYTQNMSSASVSYAYDSVTKRLSTITTRSSTYSFTYDGFGNTSNISVGSRTLASYTYNSYNGKLNTLTYGNGDKVKYYYDVLDRIKEVWYNSGGNDYIAYSYTYDSAGNVYSVEDHINDQVTMYKYDNEGKVVYSYVYDSETYTNLNGTRVVYDDQSRVFSIFHSFDYKTSSGVADDTTHYNYNYNAETGNLAKLKADGAYFSGEMIPTYDKFGRTENKIIDFSVNGSKAFYNKLIYDYVTNADSESVLVSQLISQVGKTSGSTTSTTYNYTYDNNGNITQITNASGVIQNKYYYDALGQLTREDNRAFNSTYTYSYDNAGNITSKKRYAFTTGTLGSVLNTLSYTYVDSTWKDLLTNYNGTSISYDTIGNPTTIGYAELTWQGRELTSYNDSESYELSFGYNADGIRTYKKVCDNLIGETFIHEYILNGTQIICEAVYYVGDDLELEERYRIVYLYDETGAPVGMKYREPSYAAGVFDCYFFEKNLQGDIIAVYNSNGTKLITYDYDAWGKCTTTYVAGYSACGGAVYNPFRYRGYYYDVETGWYYLQSRYYNPEWGRFLNADGYLSTGTGLMGYNMFAYCNNDPANRLDMDGEHPGELFDTIDAAAIDFALYINEKSIKDGCEYSSYIYSKTIYEERTIIYTSPIIFAKNPFIWLINLFTNKSSVRTKTIKVKITKYTYVEPSKGGKDNVILPVLGYLFVPNKVALLHTHGSYLPEYGKGNDNFSYPDKWIANITGLPFYVATPAGILKKYNPSNKEEKDLPIKIPYDPNHPYK